jgi:hypothetical protein
MKPGHMSQPSPIPELCVFVPDVRPSTEPELYDSSSDGARLPGAVGDLIGYDQVNEPVCGDTCQVEEADNDVAV